MSSNRWPRGQSEQPLYNELGKLSTSHSHSTKNAFMQNQTKSFLLAKFREMGIRPATRHGQNFLIDGNIQRLIVDSGNITKEDVILEVGFGTAVLTSMLANQAAEVVGVEIDRNMYELASEELLSFSNITLLHQDALKNKNQLNDTLMKTVQEKLAEGTNRQFKMIANLPYNIATPILSNLLFVDPLPDLMVATIQKELAERMTARPWTKDYSALSIWIQSQCDVEIIRILPPSVFWPAPKVDSAIIRIRIDPKRRAALTDPKYFHQLIKALFFHRRKFLRSNIVAAMKNHMTKQQIDAVMDEMEFGPETRAEQLDVDTLIRFCDKIRLQAPDWKL